MKRWLSACWLAHRNRSHLGGILPIEGASPIFSEGAEPDVLFGLGSFRVPVVAAPALGGPDAGPARRAVDGAGVSRGLDGRCCTNTGSSGNRVLHL